MLNINFYGLDFKEKNKINFFLEAVWVDNFSTTNAELEFTFMNNNQIKKLNKELRNINKVTDILSLEYHQNLKNNLTIKDGEFLGEIFLNIDIIKDQALANNHSYERELYFLTLHGFLHLLGYDHISKEEENEMNLIQNKILTNFNLTR